MGIGRKSPKGAHEVLPIDKRKKDIYTITECKGREHFKKKGTTDHVKKWQVEEAFHDKRLLVLATENLLAIVGKAVVMRG